MPNGLPDGTELAYYVKSQVYYGRIDLFCLFSLTFELSLVLLTFVFPAETTRGLQARKWYPM